MRRFDPRVKPERGTYELDRDHPLANGLGGAWLFNEGAGFVVSGVGNGTSPVDGKFSGSGVAWAVGPGGTGVSFPSYSSVLVPNFGYDYTKSVCFTVGALWSSGGESPIISDDQIQAGIRWSLFSDGWFFCVGPANNYLYRYDNTGLGILQTGKVFVASASINQNATGSAKYAGYLNGRQIANTQSNSPTATTTTNYFTWGSNPEGSRTFGGALYWGMIHTTAPSPSLMAWLHAEPFAMFRPLARRVYSVPSGVVPPATRLLNLRRKMVLAA